MNNQQITAQQFTFIEVNKQLCLFICFLCCGNGLTVLAQDYTTVGASSYTNTECYEITPALNSQLGAVWNKTPIDLYCDFTWTGTFNVGLDSGADGIAFVFHNATTGSSTPAGGDGTGYDGISPSIVVEFDTHENNNSCPDPTAQADPCGGCNAAGQTNHLALYYDGSFNNVLIPSFCTTTFADNTDHNLAIDWDSFNLTLNIDIDGVNVITYQDNIVTNILGGSSMVYFGFVGRTGGLNNVQKFCETTVVSNADCCYKTSGFTN